MSYAGETYEKPELSQNYHSVQIEDDLPGGRGIIVRTLSGICQRCLLPRRGVYEYLSHSNTWNPPSVESLYIAHQFI